MAEKRIELNRLYNTRDLGGYKNREGKTIRPRKLIRSGALGGGTSGDWEILMKEYQLKTIVDFRTEEEIKEKPDPQLPKVTYIKNPILSAKMLGITRESDSEKRGLEELAEYIRSVDGNCKDFYRRTYPVFVTDANALKHYKRFFQILLDQEEGAVLWHCSAGKDRVGTGTALLFSALDVDRELIEKDYLLSGGYLEPETLQMIAEIKKHTDDACIEKGVRILNGVESEYLETVFQVIDTEYGSMNHFLAEQMGLDKDKREYLKEKYLM